MVWRKSKVEGSPMVEGRPKKCFWPPYQNFLMRTMNHPPFGSFIGLRTFWWEATRFIISCTLYPSYYWKVYMENKHYMFSFHPTGTPQDSEARNKKIKLNWKRLPGFQNVCKKKAYLLDALAQPISILTLSAQCY